MQWLRQWTKDTYFFKFKSINPDTIRQIATIFNTVKGSLKTINDATNITIYTNAVVKGII